MAATPKVRFSKVTARKPAWPIMSANTSCLGNRLSKEMVTVMMMCQSAEIFRDGERWPSACLMLSTRYW
jgi:hypothetical protein